MNQTVIGVYDTKNQAQAAKESLTDAGFKSSNIDVSTYGQNGTYGERYESKRDSVSDFFGNLFGTDEQTSRRYADVAGRGTVVTVYTDDMASAKRAAAILDQYGAIDLDDRFQHYEKDTFNATANQAYLDENFSDGKIEVVKENIAVGKRDVVTGGVTVRSKIIEKPVSETLRLREEHIVVERTPVDRPASAASFRGETIKMKEVAEEAVVAKEARVVEEITVGKKVSTRTETVEDTVRETEVEIVEAEGETVRKFDKDRV